MSDIDPRDQAWLHILTALEKGYTTPPEALYEGTDITREMAEDVLQVAEENDLFDRFGTPIAQLVRVEHEEYRDALLTLLEHKPVDATVSQLKN